MLARQYPKAFKVGFSSIWTKNFQIQARFSKGRGTREQVATLLDHRKSKGVFLKKSASASLTTLKPLTMWISKNCGKFLERWEYQTTLPASWEICMQVKKQQLELEMEQWTGSKLGKEHIKAVYCHPAYLTYMQSTSWEMLGWMKHKLESRLSGEISITSDLQMTSPLWQKVMRNYRASWWKWKRKVKKLT